MKQEQPSPTGAISLAGETPRKRSSVNTSTDLSGREVGGREGVQLISAEQWNVSGNLCAQEDRTLPRGLHHQYLSLILRVATVSTYQQGPSSPPFLPANIVPFSRKRNLLHLLDSALPLFYLLSHSPSLEASFTCFETHVNDHRSYRDASEPPRNEN